MYIPIKSILLFIVQVVLIEWAIEACRFAITIAWNKAVPKQVWLSHSNRYFHFFINGLESLFVAVLLYLGYHFSFIIASDLVLIFSIKYVGNLIITRLS